MNKVICLISALLLTGCAQLGITSSVRTTFEESVDEKGFEITTWTMFVRNGIWSTIDEDVMQTLYEIDAEGKQTISQGASVSGMDSSGQIEGFKNLTDAIVKVVNPIPKINLP